MTIDALVPLPVVLPLLAAAVLMATDRHLPRRLIDALAVTTAAAVAVLCGLLLHRSLGGPVVYWFGGWRPSGGVALGIAFVIDPFGAAAALLAAVLVLAGFVYTWRYFDEAGGVYPALVLAFLGAMAGFCLTGDLFNLFVFFELMSVSAFALTGHKIEETEALAGAFHFAVVNTVGAFLVLTGIALVYGRTGALNLAQVGRALADGPPDGLVTAALVLIAAGFAVKAAVVPFHFWLADAHAVAPAPVCVLFSGVMVELGLYAVARVYWTAFAGCLSGHEEHLRRLLFAAGTLTAVLGGVMCFAQRHLKRLLAFSTISHVGLIVVAAGSLSADGLAGAGVYVVGHGLVKGGLFLCTGVLLNRYGSVDENALRGRVRGRAAVGMLFAAGGLALAGLPPFATCAGKALAEDAAGRLGGEWLTAVFVLSSALTGGAVLRAAGSVFLGWGRDANEDAKTPRREERETEKRSRRTPLVMTAPAAGLLLLSLLLGLWPAWVDEARRAAGGFQDRAAYAAVVLDGRPPAPPAAPEGPPAKGWGAGLFSAGVAVLLALTALFAHRLPLGLRRAGSLGQPLLHGLRAVHSGDVRDYVVWLVVGVAALAAAALVG